MIDGLFPSFIFQRVSSKFSSIFKAHFMHKILSKYNYNYPFHPTNKTNRNLRRKNWFSAYRFIAEISSPIDIATALLPAPSSVDIAAVVSFQLFVPDKFLFCFYLFRCSKARDGRLFIA